MIAFNIQITKCMIPLRLIAGRMAIVRPDWLPYSLTVMQMDSV